MTGVALLITYFLTSNFCQEPPELEEIGAISGMVQGAQNHLNMTINLTTNPDAIKELLRQISVLKNSPDELYDVLIRLQSRIEFSPVWLDDPSLNVEIEKTLRKLLEHRDSDIAGEAIQTYGLLGPYAHAGVRTLMKIANESSRKKDYKRLRLALDTLGFLGKYKEGDVEGPKDLLELSQKLTETYIQSKKELHFNFMGYLVDDPFVRRAAINGAEHWDEKNIDQFRRILRDEDEDESVRIAAARAYYKLGKKDLNMAHTFADLITNSQDYWVRERCLLHLDSTLQALPFTEWPAFLPVLTMTAREMSLASSFAISHLRLLSEAQADLEEEMKAFVDPGVRGSIEDMWRLYEKGCKPENKLSERCVVLRKNLASALYLNAHHGGAPIWPPTIQRNSEGRLSFDTEIYPVKELARRESEILEPKR